MPHSLRLALLLNLTVMSVASAQPASGTAEDFSAFGRGRAIAVVNDAGTETRGRLLRFTPETLTMAVKDREVLVDRNDVTAVFAQGDSLKNGMTYGAVAGGGFGAFLGIAFAGLASCGEPPRDCNPAETLGIVAIPTALIGLMGLGIGAAFDAQFTGRSQLYERPRVSGAGGPPDFSGLAGGQEVTVVENSGMETKGRLRLVTTDTMTMTVDGRNRTLARKDVTAIFERGDSVKNGMKWGFLAGATTGFAAGVSKTQCGREKGGFIFSYYITYSPCSVSERVTQGLREGALLGVLGTGIGVSIDALIPGRRLIYRKAKPAGSAAVSIAPSFAPSRASLMTSVSW